MRAAGLVSVTALVPATAVAQQPEPDRASLRSLPLIGIGYVANAPNMLLGGAAIAAWDVLGGLGLYVDAKFSHDPPSRSGFVDGTLADVGEGDRFFRAESGWRSFNVALLRPVTDELVLYLGGGVTREEAFEQFYDDSEERGEFGYYWLEDEEASGNRANVVGGAFFRFADWLLFQVGFDAEPVAMNIGAMYRLPIGR